MTQRVQPMPHLAGAGDGILESMATPHDFVGGWLQRLKTASGQVQYTAGRQDAIREAGDRWPNSDVQAQVADLIPKELEDALRARFD